MSLTLIKKLFDKVNLPALHHSEDSQTDRHEQGARCKTSGWWHQLFASSSSKGQWHPDCSTIGGRTHLPWTSLWGLKMMVQIHPDSHSAHIYCQLETSTSGTCKPSCSKTYIKHLLLKQIPIETDSSARDPSTGSSPYWTHHVFMWVPRSMGQNWFPLPWHYQCVSSTETGFDKQNYPKMTISHLGREDFLMLSSFPPCMLWTFCFPKLVQRLFSPFFDSSLQAVRK